MASRSDMTSGKADWYFQGGLSETMPKSANGYAQRLVRYIADASTVRMRVLDEYGKAPSLEKIRGWRADWTALVASREMPLPDEDEDGSDPALGWSPRPVCQPESRAIAPAFQPPANDDRPGMIDGAAAGCADVAGAVVDDPIVAAQPRTAAEVMAQCCAACGVSVEDLLGRSRRKRLVVARQLTATVLRARRNSYPKVGYFIGRRDHSTALYSVHAFFDVVMRDPDMVAIWMRLAPCMAKVARSSSELDMITGMTAWSAPRKVTAPR